MTLTAETTQTPEARQKPGRFFLAGRYQLKIALSYIAIIIAMLVLFNSYPILISQSLIFRAKENSLSTRAGLIASSLASLDILTAKDAGQIMGILNDQGVSRIVVTDADGLAVYDNAVTENTQGRYVLRPEIFRALAGADVFVSAYAEGAFESRAAVPVMGRGRVLGAVYLYEYDAEQARILQALQDNMTSISVVLASLVLVLSIVLSRALARRLSDLLRGIRLVRAGQYSHRVTRRGRDELASLADEFNELTGRLQKTEAARRRFVADASHELKTPLASIRLLADSILQTENIDTSIMREFVTDIGDESDRLTRLTEKLLALTRLDAEVFEPTATLDLKKVIVLAAHRLKPLAKQAGVSVEVSADDGCLVEAGADGLYQIVFNLMENAVKYNRPEGTVRALSFVRDGRVTLIVDNTGPGIAEEDLPRVFERFYRVDKARSREAGGAGLGLSIVKDTVERYGGDVRLESPPGGSTRAVASFPLSPKRQGGPA
ncbi:MAG: HAMP domain-containing histidine kinase [Oscillospiraceae bacterium]|nr:HAMP domain-containing histidine kinase [Oscillospiraceae bacterium]